MNELKSCEPSTPIAGANKESPENPQQSQDSSNRRAKTEAVLAWLCQTFPLAFNEQRSRALKRNIDRDIKPLIPENSEITIRAIRYALGFYASSKDYHKTVLQADQRVDLKGIKCEPVTEQQKQYSAAQLRQIQKRIFQKRFSAKQAS